MEQEVPGTHPLWHISGVPPPFNTVHADTVLITWFVMALALAVVAVLAATHPITIVSKRYSLLELIVTAIGNLAGSILGKGGLPYVPYIISLFLFILLMNEIGLFPFIGKSPTADLNTTAALALTTILLIQIVGIKNHGLGYYKHLVIRPIILGILMLPITLIDELVRPVTLAMRLFGNIFAGEILLLLIAAVFAAHLGIISHAMTAAPVAVYVFNMFIGIIQATVFTLLTIAYLITPTQGSTDH